MGEDEEDAPSSLLRERLVIALFFASGAAGLVYEVAWVRQFGNVFGNTVYSAALVTAVFMLGLGLGSRGAGGWADRRVLAGGGADGGDASGDGDASRALYRAYALSELGIALFGVLLAFALPRLDGLSAATGSYVRDAAGWYEPSVGASAIRYGAAVMLVLPPTILMGATLTLLVRATLVRGVELPGYRIGLL